MFLTLKNIGKIRKAEIELKGITVIAGENNTGKSTVGKALYCMFNSLYGLKNEIRQTRRLMLEYMIYDSFDMEFKSWHIDIGRLAERIIAGRTGGENEDVQVWLKKTVLDYLDEYPGFKEDCRERIKEEQIEPFLKKIKEFLAISDEAIAVRILQKNIDAEFKGQIGSFSAVKTESEIGLKIKDREIRADLEGKQVLYLEGMADLKTQAFYLDDPFILDELFSGRGFMTAGRRLDQMPESSRNFMTHRNRLKYCLESQEVHSGVEGVIEELMIDSRMKRILDKIDTVCHGELRPSERSGCQLSDNAFAEPLCAENISTGLKTFIILKILLVKGYLEDNGTIILDEPEVHLHPEWQLVFAELIVLLQKEFGMHILLNTHSPYFLNALEVYSKKYKIADKCRYYLAENREKYAVFQDVTADREPIYAKRARPLRFLEQEEQSDEEAL